MEVESFEDEEVAKWLNDSFVSMMEANLLMFTWIPFPLQINDVFFYSWLFEEKHDWIRR
jgi:hypothetical protein